MKKKKYVISLLLSQNLYIFEIKSNIFEKQKLKSD